ncbi:hypothetical protein [Caldisalinibacter kiritimatiensis]|uniref:Uncharacterized protein n=1 Tax=Caldisalinibacter kiritimatiensis TaxID=1304284 RepID=R1CX11_9FIRM|nr:hypothetical protein [Caldisalinibacter kiritimatiensis]EOD01164.1 hypothetical protein L21TH_0769 [Caldisalinibacter kiritimatiensis]
MKITNGFIKLEGNEFKTLFNYLDEEIQYPEYLQILILKEFLKSLGLKPRNDDNDLDSLFSMIPIEVLEEIVEVINNLYSIQQKVDYKNIYLPYLIYYLPINTYKVHRLLSDLILRNLLKKDITLLDVGTGPGSVVIGVIEFYKILAKEYSSINFSIQLSILDAEKKFLKIAENLIKEISKDLPRNLSVNIKEVMNIKLDNWFTISGNYDLICTSNVLNRFEIEDNFYISNFFKLYQMY